MLIQRSSRFLVAPSRAQKAARRHTRKLVLLVLACVAVWSGCARVAPYERGTLARSDMELGENPDLAAGEEHGLAYREGSSGGGTAKGGGCGCN
jgi:hypothetical protein